MDVPRILKSYPPILYGLLKHLNVTDSIHLFLTVPGLWFGVKKNKEFILRFDERRQDLAAVKINGMCIGLIPDLTHEICLAAVKQNGLALQFVPLEIKDDEVCLAAVKQDMKATKYITKELWYRSMSNF